MGVNWNNINRSGARTKNNTAMSEPPKFEVVDAGQKVRSPVYGNGVTCEAFVSDSDWVLCRFEEYDVYQKGCAVRQMIGEHLRH